MVLGTGSSVPARILSNSDLEQLVETTDEWISTRTGIKTRRIAGPGETTSVLAAAAGAQALAMAGLNAADLDVIIVGTMTAEMTMPSAACMVQKELGALHALAFDINAACSGFVYGLTVADKFVRADPSLRVLVIGSETMSSRLNWEDRATCVLFGDGAGACVVSGGKGERGILSSQLFADGRLWNLLSMPAAPSMNPALRAADDNGSYIRMQGQDVFRYAVRAMEQAIGKVLVENGLQAADLALVIPHQANIRIIRSLADRLAVPEEKFYINIDKYGNTSAASVPIAMDEANREGRLMPGDLVLLCAFGGGFTWGAMVIRW